MLSEPNLVLVTRENSSGVAFGIKICTLIRIEVHNMSSVIVTQT